jgi:hypothetical protein
MDGMASYTLTDPDPDSGPAPAAIASAAISPAGPPPIIATDCILTAKTSKESETNQDQIEPQSTQRETIQK